MDSVDNEVVIEERKSHAINTHKAYIFINENQDEFPYPLLVEFRERLEDILNINKCVNATFHPLDWKYHKGLCKEIEVYNESWRNLDSGIFRPYYFLRNVYYKGLEIYESMTDEAKEKLSQSLKDEGENNWERWSYEVCQLNYPYLLSFGTDYCEDFEFFFAWQILGTDLYEIRDFLDWHFVNSFNNEINKLSDFIKILFLKYKRILTNVDNKQVVFNCLNEMEKSVLLMPEIDSPTVIAKNTGRKAKDKIEIPIPPKRNKEKWTIFSKDETIQLFDYLIQLECLVNDTKKVSKESIAKAIYAITGYSDNDTAELFLFEDKKPKTKKEQRIIVDNIKELITKNLRSI